MVGQVVSLARTVTERIPSPCDHPRSIGAHLRPRLLSESAVAGTLRGIKGSSLPPHKIAHGEAQNEPPEARPFRPRPVPRRRLRRPAGGRADGLVLQRLRLRRQPLGRGLLPPLPHGAGPARFPRGDPRPVHHQPRPDLGRAGGAVLRPHARAEQRGRHDLRPGGRARRPALGLDAPRWRPAAGERPDHGVPERQRRPPAAPSGR
jgi:hypothetical protein